jgi:stage V sporulation protein G
MIEVTAIKFRVPVERDEHIVALATIELDHSFVVHDLKVLRGETGLYVRMPSRRIGEHQFVDIVHPTNNETRKYLHQIVLDRYQEFLETQSTPE